MKLVVESDRLCFDGDAVRYESRYLAPADFPRIIAEWVRRLRTEPTETIQLPFSIDDEYVEAFEVKGGEAIELRVVRLDNIGYVHKVDPLIDSLTRQLPIVHRYPQPFLCMNKEELVAALSSWLEQQPDGSASRGE